ncbi:type IV toxin-antitoxin system AbiEi family antitoxin [Dasania sp. GY-MA-18]|uniref:Type IV toxin-antitoxin system AbiEi family antitoxin n=1 Tax=Dasania phycosphaerae TaxID=2950436 RepID=A0A9J6RMD0_9GAMM|nr:MULTISPECIES: type IV toxin-antitoxin system AbiEi family antitoxin [Dasania]MCR8923196.1 type IV toxin-antitoxin system AbiEi family antitoxin [Dasania sp. GY-MA-18]MCZ0865628.1 type IV toxin-antitoxin system AbiEi family antitoxin [Dasania phycosphaerae]MCZ0869353.1 type IV toxin-antitoxin system AbiEi family antitoxin [Dasania phycosphaerae]
MKRVNEIGLLQDAVKAFKKETGLKIAIIKNAFMEEGRPLGGLVELPNGAGQLAVGLKNWAAQANLGAIANQIERLPIEGMLVADYINPNMAAKLRAMAIQFIDTAGNAYINKPPLYVWVTTNKNEKAQEAKKEAPNRAFDAAGLKVIFGLLCDQQLINAAYREIAEKTGVALGTVGKVIDGLKETGFVVDRGKGKQGRRLVNRHKLLDRWVEAYPEKLKPKCRVGDFVADNPSWWKTINIEKFGAYWGGEVAATKYTGYLKPQVVTVYLPEQLGNKFLAAAKLKKALEWTADGPGIVKIYRPFWPQKIIDTVGEGKNQPIAKTHAGLVHPILAYADLIATADSRNLETARKIYEQHIAEHIGQD